MVSVVVHLMLSFNAVCVTNPFSEDLFTLHIANGIYIISDVIDVDVL